MKNQKQLSAPTTAVEPPPITPYLKSFGFSASTAALFISIAMFMTWYTGERFPAIVFTAALLVLMGASWFWYTYGCASQQEIDTKIRRVAVNAVKEESDLVVQQMQAGCEAAIGMLAEQSAAAIAEIRGQHREEVVGIKKNLAAAIRQNVKLTILLEFAERFLTPQQRSAVISENLRLARQEMKGEPLTQLTDTADVLTSLSMAVGDSVQHRTAEPAPGPAKLHIVR